MHKSLLMKSAGLSAVALAAAEAAGSASTASATATKRAHKATYATDKKKGGYIVRVEGPHAALFAGRDVPVITRDGVEHIETLTKILWSGNDEESGKPVALYNFESKPRVVAEVDF